MSIKILCKITASLIMSDYKINKSIKILVKWYKLKCAVEVLKIEMLSYIL
jgi:hypothetical protein